MNRVMRLGDRTAHSLMTPRTRIAWLDIDSPQAENIQVLLENKFSRFPVYRGSDNDIVGILETKVLTRYLAQEGIGNLFAELSEPLFVSESTRALTLIEIFREEGAHMAFVVDEYGDLQGVVTLNDVIGAVLGQIQQQEADAGDYSAPVVQRDDGSYLVDGSLPSEDLRELLEVSALPNEDEHDFNTAAGMVVVRFGRIPAPGEHFSYAGWRIEVIDLDGARVDKLLIQRLNEPADVNA